jgi:hypothetical protein
MRREGASFIANHWEINALVGLWMVLGYNRRGPGGCDTLSQIIQRQSSLSLPERRPCRPAQIDRTRTADRARRARCTGRATGHHHRSVNMSPGVTEVGQSIFDLHMAILWICVVIGVVVFGVMFYSIIYHRKSRGVVPAQFHESTKVEIAWTVVPFLILIGMAVPATSTLLDIYDFEDAEMDILVTGYQWKWKYEYLAEDGENVAFFSNLSTPQSEIYNTAEKER